MEDSTDTIVKSIDSSEPDPVKTVAFCRFIVGRTKLAFGLTLAFHLLIIVATIVLQFTDQEPFPTRFKSKPMDLRNDEMYLRGLAVTRKVEDVKVKIRKKRADTDYNQQVVTIYYEADNMLTEERLLAVTHFENKISNMNCKVTPSFCGQKPDSITRFINASQGIDLKLIIMNLTKMNLTSTYLGGNVVLNPSKVLRANVIRTIFYIGIPYDVYNWYKFFAKHFSQIFRDTAKSGLSGGVSFFYFYNIYEELAYQVMRDLYLGAGSFTFIVIFMLFQTRSLFITGFGIFSILSSFLGANLVYRYVFSYKFFGVPQILGVFIILGIGVDDLFVYYDTWRATASQDYETLLIRTSACYKMAAKSMFITSFTTIIAFVLNCGSPLFMVLSYGLFSGILIFVNFISVITFFPTVVVMHHKYIQSSKCRCSKCCYAYKSKKHDLGNNCVVTFFKNYFLKLLTHWIGKWIIVVVFTLLVATFAYFASTLDSQTEKIQWFIKSHNYEMFQQKRDIYFREGKNKPVIQVYIVWGLKNQDLGICSKTDYECLGNTSWDKYFDLNPKPAQQAVLLLEVMKNLVDEKKLCNKIRDFPDLLDPQMHIRKNKEGKGEIICYIELFERYIKAMSGGTITLPWSEHKMRLFFKQQNLQMPEKENENYYRYFDLMVKYGLERISYSPLNQLLLITQENQTLYQNKRKPESFEYYRLRFAAVTINTTIEEYTLNYKRGLTISDAWENFTKTNMAMMPPSVSDAFQCTPKVGELEKNYWHWFRVQKVLAESATNGIVISIFVSLVILTIATHNLILGFLATLTVGCVVISVLGIIPIVGWKLGVLESMNLSLVVGLSIDYVVHLAEGYNRSHYGNRYDKLRDTLEHVGISVLSGACTTIGASIVLLFAQILFFFQFGLFMLCTIGFSFIYSIVFFTTILGIVGPENEKGSLIPLYQRLKVWLLK